MAAAAELTETGSPAFVVMGIESIGLDAVPTDLQRMPDGRIFLLAPRVIALGDGVRWKTFHQSPADPTEAGPGAAIDHDGRIYLGTAAGIARIEFTDDGFWRLAPVTPWAPAGAPPLSIPQARVTNTGSHWIWHSQTGPLVAWRPGESPRLLGAAESFEQVFEFEGEILLSERDGGPLSRLRDQQHDTILKAGTFTAITATVPLGEGRLLVGTYGRGLQVFDGRTVAPLTATGPLAGGTRIIDLCSTEGPFFAAALDNLGVLFFNRDGRVLQTADRFLDQRLARVKRLVTEPGGVIWGLLEGGVVRIAFPAPVSNFEPLLSAGLTTVHPLRIGGRLWIHADGKVYRGRYDSDGRLAGLDDDAPGLEFINVLSTAETVPVAGSEAGPYFRGASGWEPFAPGIRSLRVLPLHTEDGCWLYAATAEIGLLRVRGGRVEIAERIPVPGLGDSFNKPVADRAGSIWLELGLGRVVRLRLAAGRPHAELFGPEHGTLPSWPQLFTIDGTIAANFADRVLRFDEAGQRFVAAGEFTRQFPGVDVIFGRPALDTAGRVWLTSEGTVRVFEKHGEQWAPVPLHVPVGFAPYYFTFEGGVVWMHAQHRFARFDPSLPAPRATAPRTQITHVTLTTGSRLLFPVDGRLPPLAYADNSLTVHFLAGGNPFANPVTFETRLQGTGEDWTPCGSLGSVTFNRLKEGSYVFEVRPRSGKTVGAPTTQAFVIRPPWYRTTWAYLLYILIGLATIGGAAAGWSFLARRDRSRLEYLVSHRTAQLRQSEERYRVLNSELEQRVAERTAALADANAKLVDANRELEAFSYSVSHDLRSPLRNISGFASLLQQRVATVIDKESARFLGIVANEAVRLSQLIDSLLAFSRLGRAELKEVPVELQSLVETVRRDLATEQNGRNIDWQLGALPSVVGDPTLLRQVFANLVGNALKFTRGRSPALITVGTLVDPAHPRHHTFFVRDNGAGFDPKYSANLFGVFQRLHSAKEFEGTGIGLANVRRIVARHGGQVWAEGAPDQGATFYFTLPGVPAPAAPPPADH